MAESYPLGILPRREHDQRRANDIHQAVNRYFAAGIQIPPEWIEEYNELVHKVSDHSVFSVAVHDVERPPSKTVDIVEDGRDPNRIHYSAEPDELPICGAVSKTVTCKREIVECLDCMTELDRS